MATSFNPAHQYVIWPDFSGTNGRIIKADQVEVSAGGALIFSSRGNDNVLYITTVISATSYAHFEWYGDAAIDLKAIG